MFRKSMSMVLTLVLVLSLFSIVPSTNAKAESTKYLFGDLDGNGSITNADLLKVARFIEGIDTSLTDEQQVLADVNGDGILNQSDVDEISNYRAGKISTFSIHSKLIDYGYYNVNVDPYNPSEISSTVKYMVKTDGTLIVFGEGEMGYYYVRSNSPWYNYRDSINKVEIRNGVTSIGNGAFLQFSNLTTVILSNSITIIQASAFESCSSLENINLPNSIVEIRDNAFIESGLKDITIPNSVKRIERCAFYDCHNLEYVTIPKSVTYLGYDMFFRCYNLKSICVDNDNPSYSSLNGSLYNKDRTEIIQYALGRNDSYFVVPNSVIHIGSPAFSNSKLVGIEIPNGVISISCSFQNCERLTNITLPNSVNVSYSDAAFDGCTSLKEIHLSNALTSIRNFMFRNCTSLYSVEIPDGVTSIGYCTFSGCSNLSSVTIPNSVSSIDSTSFDNCSSSLVIYGYRDSYAETYAKNNSITFVAINGDTTKPTVSLSSTNNVASSQTVTISLSDNVGIKGYYWGTSSTYSNNSYTSTSNTSISKTVDASGTYYATAVDTSGNVSSNVSITFYKTTLNANNGSVSPTSVLTKSGNSFTFPTPTRSGYSYVGWSTSSSASSGVKTLSPSSNSTYYAVWSYNDTQNPTVSLSSTNNVASSQTVTISLSDNVGIKGYYWGTSSTYSNNSYTSTSNTSISKTVDASGTYYATAVDTSGNVSSNVSITFYKTTLNANNGSVSPTSVLTKSGNSFTFPTPTRSGYSYVGWSTSSSASSGVKTLSPSSNSTYYAVWSYTDTQKPTVSLSSTNNVASSQTVTISLSDNVGIRGYYWGTSSTYSNNSYTSTSNTSVSKTVDASGTYYATAVDTSGNVSSNVSITFYKTTLNANGGSVSPTSILTKSGNSFTFPTPTRSNYSYVGWSTSSSSSSGVKTLSPSSNSTYYAVWEPCYTFVWGQDNWNFYNSDEYFGKYYYVDDSIINTFRNQFSVDNTELYTMKQKMNNYNSRYGFQGSCYGMTISEILVKQGNLNLSDYGGNSIVNRNNNSNRKVVSLINAIQLMQNVGDFSQTIRQAPFSRGSFTQYEYISKLEDVLQNSHMFVKIGYSIKDRVNSTGEYIEPGSHAVLAYGIENCNYYSNVTYKTYDRRILICDPNRSGKNTISDDACIYYKSSDHSWIIPYWYGEYYNYNYGKITEMCYWNAGSSLGTKTGSLNNIMKYDTVSESTNLMSEYSTDHYIAGLEIDSDNEASVQEIKETGNPNMEFAGGSGTGVAKFTTEYEQNAIDNNPFDSYALWNPTANYSVSFSKPSKVNTFMDYENTSYYIEASNSNYILFKPSGYMQMNGSESDYSITMVTDSSECVTDWYAVTVTGSDIDKLTYKKEKNGYILSSTSLNNVSIKAENDSITTSRSFTTDYNSVFIYEIDKTHIGIKVDKDNNGTYETELPVDYPEVPDELLLGDVDGDGTIMITDATFIQRKMAQIDIPFDFSNDIADVDGDGEVTLMDATYIQRWLANLKSNDNIGKPVVGG